MLRSGAKHFGAQKPARRFVGIYPQKPCVLEHHTAATLVGERDLAYNNFTRPQIRIASADHGHLRVGEHDAQG